MTLTGVMTELGPLIGKTVTETSKLLFSALFKSPFFLPLCVLFLLFHFSSFLKVMKGDDELCQSYSHIFFVPKKVFVPLSRLKTNLFPTNLYAAM